MGYIWNDNLTANEYQHLAARTIDKNMTREEMEMHALHGMVGEIGEIHSLYQKKFQGHELNYDHVLSEVGDCIWFLTEYCSALGIPLADVLNHNIDKLKKRYPDGFDAEHSLHRAEGDI